MCDFHVTIKLIKNLRCMVVYVCDFHVTIRSNSPPTQVYKQVAVPWEILQE